MLLVDTSVWIDHFRNGPGSEVRILRDLIEQEEDLCICGPIRAEVLQGIRRDSEYLRTKKYFDSLIYLPIGRGKPG